MSSRIISSFSSIESGFMLKSLIHLDLIFVQGDKYGKFFIFLHIDSQLDLHHLLKMLSCFSIIYVLLLCQRSSICKCVVLFSCLHSIPLINMPISIPVPCCFYHYFYVVKHRVRDGNFPQLFFYCQQLFSLFWLFFCLSR